MKISRREFFKTAAIFGTAILVESCGRDRESVPDISVVPEYDRTLSEVMIAAPSAGNVDIDAFSDTQAGLIKALPEYTRVILLSDGNSHQPIMEKILDVPGISNRINISRVVIPSERPRDIEHIPWVQDAMEPVTKDGKPAALVPLSRGVIVGQDGHWYYKQPIPSREQARNDMIRRMYGNDGIVQAGWYFEGGNTTFDVINGQVHAFVSYRDILKTIEIYKGRGQKIDGGGVIDLIKATVSAKEVHVMGEGENQSPYAHNDQYFTFLRNKKFIAHSIKTSSDGVDSSLLDSGEYSGHGSKIIEKLTSLGYEGYVVPVDAQDASSGHSNVNCIPYRDRQTGRDSVIFPVFAEDYLGDLWEDKVPLTRERLTGRGANVYDVFVSLGYEPHLVKDLSGGMDGSLHCMINVIK